MSFTCPCHPSSGRAVLDLLGDLDGPTCSQCLRKAPADVRRRPTEWDMTPEALRDMMKGQARI